MDNYSIATEALSSIVTEPGASDERCSRLTITMNDVKRNEATLARHNTELRLLN